MEAVSVKEAPLAMASTEDLMGTEERKAMETMEDSEALWVTETLVDSTEDMAAVESMEMDNDSFHTCQKGTRNLSCRQTHKRTKK
jgi:hypothetical protein